MEQMLRLSPARLYFVRTQPERLDYIVLLALLFAIGAAAGLFEWLAPRFASPFRGLFEAPVFVLCAMAVEHLMHSHIGRYPPLWNAVARGWNRLGVTAVDGWFFTGLVAGLMVVLVFYRWPIAWSISKPFLYGGAAALWLACASKIVRPPLPLPDVIGRVHSQIAADDGSPGPPVVWIILDEWDYDLTYNRSDGKVFPELERLRRQSLFLEDVRAAGRVTLTAIPALLIGRPVKEWRTANANSAKFSSGSAQFESFPGPPTIFQSAKEMGYHTHLVGWYHPYCRMFGDQAESCWWDDLTLPSLRPGRPVLDRARAFLRDAFELEMLPVGGPANNMLKQMGRVRPMIAESSRVAALPGRNFSFLHLPVPHGPFFKLVSDRMVPVQSNTAGYQYGLDAADRAVGQVRAAMELSGVWDGALVVVTSDHPYRYQFGGGYGNGHIPMMIKLPHQSTPGRYRHPFQAVETKDLLENVMRGHVPTPDRLLAWLERGSAHQADATQPPPEPMSLDPY